MRKTLVMAALVLAFSCPALAGEMHTPASPAPPPATVTQETTTADSLTQTVLDILAALPSLF
jgi:hypothetical protein